MYNLKLYLFNKSTNSIFAKKFLLIICMQPVKRNLHIFSFSSRAFQKCIFYHFLSNLLQTFLLYNWISQQKFVSWFSSTPAGIGLKRFICLKWILKISTQNYIPSSTTIQCRSLSLKISKFSFLHPLDHLIYKKVLYFTIPTPSGDKSSGVSQILLFSQDIIGW